MLLVVDVGNTQTHFGTFRDGQLLEHWRFATVRQSTADQLGAADPGLSAGAVGVPPPPGPGCAPVAVVVVVVVDVVVPALTVIVPVIVVGCTVQRKL